MEDWEIPFDTRGNMRNLAGYTDCVVDKLSSINSSFSSENFTPKFDSYSEKLPQDPSVIQLRSQVSSLTQSCTKLNENVQRLRQDLEMKAQKISELECKNKALHEILLKNEDEKNYVINLNKSINKSLQAAIDEYLVLTNEFKKKWNMPDYDSKKLIKYSRFLVKTIKSNAKLKTMFDDRVPSEIKNHELETPFLNILQFLCDLLVHQPSQCHQFTQTKTSSFVPDFKNVSPRKFANNDDYLTETDLGFEVSRDSESFMKNVNLQSERLARLHRQISETMQTNKFILKNPLKAQHSRSRSEIINVKK